MPSERVMKIEIMAKLATAKRQGFAGVLFLFFFSLHERKHYRMYMLYLRLIAWHCILS